MIDLPPIRERGSRLPDLIPDSRKSFTQLMVEQEERIEVWNRRTYEMVAEVIKESYEYAYDREKLARRFSVVFERDNPRFDSERFRRACVGVSDKEVGRGEGYIDNSKSIADADVLGSGSVGEYLADSQISGE